MHTPRLNRPVPTAHPHANQRVGQGTRHGVALHLLSGLHKHWQHRAAVGRRRTVNSGAAPGSSSLAGGAEGQAGRGALGTRFLAEPLRSELQQRAYTVAAQLDPESQAQVSAPPAAMRSEGLLRRKPALWAAMSACKVVPAQYQQPEPRCS